MSEFRLWTGTKIECTSCKATGIYAGAFEPEGVGVVCRDCGGSGERQFHYTPFTGRRARGDINTVHWSTGFIPLMGTGPSKQSVTYREFLEGKLPPE